MQAVHKGKRATQAWVCPIIEYLKTTKSVNLSGSIVVSIFYCLIGYDIVIAFLILCF